MAIESASQDATAVMQAQQAAQAEYVKTLSELFEIIDSGNLGKITVGAFEESMDNERVKGFFSSIDLSVGDAWELFKLLDTDETHMINIEDFVAGCLQLRGHARSVDIALLRYEVKWMMEGFRRFMTTTTRQLQLVVSMVRDAHEASAAVHALVADGWSRSAADDDFEHWLRGGDSDRDRAGLDNDDDSRGEEERVDRVLSGEDEEEKDSPKQSLLQL